MHRYDYGGFWPNLRESDFDYIGTGTGLGHNINLPLNKVKITIDSRRHEMDESRLILFFNNYFKTRFGNEEYLAAFFNLLLPIAYEVSSS